MKKLIQDIFYHDGKSLIDKTGMLIFSCYFLVLFSYPLVRSASDALFLDAYSANDYPFATFVTVIALAVVIGISNQLQKIFSVHQVYMGIGIVSSIVIAISLILFSYGLKEMAYVIFATKEIYIVLLISLLLAFANGYFSLVAVKKLYGPLGAMGSIGGIIGGQITSVVATKFGTAPVVYLSIMAILFTCVTFYQTRFADFKITKDEFEVTPIKAIENVKKYVFLIAMIVALSQFVIFVADLQFKIVFEKIVENKDLRTAYFGKIYSYVNMGALFLQFAVLPYILMRFKTRSNLLFVPVLFMLLIFIGISFGVSNLWVSAGIFISMKAVDYSIFAVAKEILYHPLSTVQKYGAKYITDIFVYRLAKGAMAIGIYYVSKTLVVLNTIQFISISLWVIVIILIFKEQKRLKIEEE